MDLNLFARDMLRADGGNANMDAVLAALEGDKDAVIQALWRGRTAPVKDDQAVEDRETLRKGIADMLEIPIGCFMNEGWQKDILENLNEYADDAEGRRDRMDILRHFICRDLFNLTPDDFDGREHELADRLKALNDEKNSAVKERDALRTAWKSANEERCALVRFSEDVRNILGISEHASLQTLLEDVRGLSESYDALDRERDALVRFRDSVADVGPWPKEDLDALAGKVVSLSRAQDVTEDAFRAAAADRDTLRDGIARVLGVPAGEFCGYSNWATDMVTRLVGETDDAHNTYTMFHQEIVNALGGGVATEEQILQAVKDLIARPASPPLLVCPPVDPRVAALEAEIEALKEKAAVDAIMTAQGKMPMISRLQDEIASLRTILFAHESREMLLQADLRRAQEALRAAGQPLPQEASANSRVPAIPGVAPADAGRPPTWLTAGAGFSRSATSLTSLE